MSGDMLECYDVGRCSRHPVGRVQGMQLNILQRTGQPHNEEFAVPNGNSAEGRHPTPNPRSPWGKGRSGVTLVRFCSLRRFRSLHCLLYPDTPWCPQLVAR